MKRSLNLRNKIAIATIFIGLLFTSSSFTFGPVDGTISADNGPQKKEQRVKVIVNKNGKETKIGLTTGVAVYTPNLLRRMKVVLENKSTPDLSKGKIHVLYSSESDTRPVKLAEADLAL